MCVCLTMRKTSIEQTQKSHCIVCCRLTASFRFSGLVPILRQRLPCSTAAVEHTRLEPFPPIAFQQKLGRHLEIAAAFEQPARQTSAAAAAATTPVAALSQFLPAPPPALRAFSQPSSSPSRVAVVGVAAFVAWPCRRTATPLDWCGKRYKYEMMLSLQKYLTQ